MTTNDYRDNTGMSSGNFSVYYPEADCAGYLPCVPVKIAVNLRQLRAKKRVSQVKVARALGYTTAVSYHRWEKGSRIPSRANVERLAEYFETTYDAIDPDGEAWEPEALKPEALKHRAQPDEGHGARAHESAVDEMLVRYVTEYPEIRKAMFLLGEMKAEERAKWIERMGQAMFGKPKPKPTRVKAKKTA